MTSCNRTGLSLKLMLAAVLIFSVTIASAAERKGRRLKAGEYNPDNESVEMFAAMEAGQIEVKLIHKDSTRARIIIKNKSDKPLNVELPKAFAGVPVLAQFGGGQQGGGGGGGQGGGQQSSGGGGGGGGQQGGGQGGGQGGFFNVPAEKVGQVRVACVCLEHGKDEPRPAIPYDIKPITAFTSDPAVHELCRMLGEGKLDQRAAQAAAWHLANGMSWEELAAKQIKRLNGPSYPYFSRQEIMAGIQIANHSIELGKALPVVTPSTADQASLSGKTE